MGSDKFIYVDMDVVDISIHAPRMGSDLRSGAILFDKIGFQSTLPAWGATPNLGNAVVEL